MGLARLFVKLKLVVDPPSAVMDAAPMGALPKLAPFATKVFPVTVQFPVTEAPFVIKLNLSH